MKLAKILLALALITTSLACSKSKDEKNVLRITFDGTEYVMDDHSDAAYEMANDFGLTIFGTDQETYPHTLTLEIVSSAAFTAKNYLNHENLYDPLIGVSFTRTGPAEFEWQGGLLSPEPLSVNISSFNDSRVAGTFIGAVTRFGVKKPISGAFNLPVRVNP